MITRTFGYLGFVNILVQKLGFLGYCCCSELVKMFQVSVKLLITLILFLLIFAYIFYFIK